MSFIGFDYNIAKDGLAMAWSTRDNIKAIRPTRNDNEVIDDKNDNTTEKGKQNNAYFSRFGAFSFEKMIGKPYGSQISSDSSVGFIHLVHPTPELWTLSLPHRTQIVYTPDISFIVQKLRILPGSSVIEAGTGSASFTHSLARTVGKNGKVYTYEFHEPRYLAAKKELHEHGLSGIVNSYHADVCTQGFKSSLQQDENSTSLESDNNNNNNKPKDILATAIFLDLPSPWGAIPHLTRGVIAPNKMIRICCFSPCIEQVSKTISVLESEGWHDIETFTISCKKYEARKQMIRNVDDAIKRLKSIKQKRKEGLEKRHERILMSKDSSDDVNSHKISLEDGNSNSSDDESTNRKQKIQKLKNDGSKICSPNNDTYNPWGAGKRVQEGDPAYDWLTVTQVEREIKSHTSYLTFAFKPPIDCVL